MYSLPSNYTQSTIYDICYLVVVVLEGKVLGLIFGLVIDIVLWNKFITLHMYPSSPRVQMGTDTSWEAKPVTDWHLCKW